MTEPGPSRLRSLPADDVSAGGHDAAAARLGIPEGTVFSRGFYALRILRQELGVSPPADVHRAA